MDITNPQRAKVLVHALPYIQEYSGKIVVIKYGGNAMISDKLKDSVMRDIVLLSLIGVKVVLVHGGGPEITETLEKLGKQTQFVDVCASRTRRRPTSCRWSSPGRSTRRLSTSSATRAAGQSACRASTGR